MHRNQQGGKVIIRHARGERELAADLVRAVYSFVDAVDRRAILRDVDVVERVRPHRGYRGGCDVGVGRRGHGRVDRGVGRVVGRGGLRPDIHLASLSGKVDPWADHLMGDLAGLDCTLNDDGNDAGGTG